MKKILLAVALAAVSGGAFAQYEGSTMDDRIAATMGENEDSIKEARGYVSLYQTTISQQDWKEAYTNWKWLIEKAPFSISGLYKGNAPFMLYTLINQETDEAQKLAYFKDLMMLFQKRADNLDALNSFEKRDNLKSTMGDVLAVKADYYNWTAPTVPGSGYTLNQSYANYSEAIKMINEKGGREIEGTVLQNFFLVSDAMYKANNATMREKYLQDYLDSKAACEKMLQLAKEAEAAGDTAKATKLVEKYDGPLAFIEATFAASGAADREQIIALYTKTIEANKDNLAYLNSALNLMAANDCDDADIYYTAAKYAYQIEPTYRSAIGLAQLSQKQGKASEALTYYDKALELASSDQARGIICLNIAKSLARTNTAKSIDYTNKAIEFNPDLAGKAYYQQAQILASAKNYAEAISYCNKAAAADITVSGSASRLKAEIQRVQAVNAEHARQKAEYDKYKADQKKEEDFWNGAGKK